MNINFKINIKNCLLLQWFLLIGIFKLSQKKIIIETGNLNNPASIKIHAFPLQKIFISFREFYINRINYYMWNPKNNVKKLISIIKNV